MAKQILLGGFNKVCACCELVGWMHAWFWLVVLGHTFFPQDLWMVDALKLWGCLITRFGLQLPVLALVQQQTLYEVSHGIFHE